MCELCSEDTAVRDMAREGSLRLAARFARLSRHYERLSFGRIKPHDVKEIDSMKHDARFAAKALVDEWL